jgi:predicted NAD-dependent protein-ADP-ribosyltransferase YbiA (DUF1768 family)
MKFCFSNKSDFIHKINWKDLTSQDVKKMGSKTFFKKNNIVLDVDKWNKYRDIIMEILIEKRYKNDVLFAKILNRIKQLQLNLIHYSTRDKYWGAYKPKNSNQIIGKNKLGKIFLKIAS